MKEQDVIRLKNKKPFAVSDIIVYTVLALFVLSLFLAFVIIPSNQPSTGFKVTKGEQEVLTFNYQTKNITINNTFANLVEFDNVNSTIIVYNNTEKTDFNVIHFDAVKGVVEMVESTCSTTKDCVYSPPIKKDTGMIYCAPHHLKIVPLGNSYVPPVVG